MTVLYTLEAFPRMTVGYRKARVKNKHKRLKARILLIAALSLSSMLIIALVMLTIELVNYGRDRKLYDEACALAVQTVDPMQTPTPFAPSPEIPVILCHTLNQLKRRLCICVVREYFGFSVLSTDVESPIKLRLHEITTIV